MTGENMDCALAHEEGGNDKVAIGIYIPQPNQTRRHIARQVEDKVTVPNYFRDAPRQRHSGIGPRIRHSGKPINNSPDQRDATGNLQRSSENRSSHQT